MLRVAAPWVKTALYADDVYAIPGQRWVTVGGTRQYGDWMAEVSPHDSARIWSRATATFPTLAGAKLLEEVVGLRPHRYTPRYTPPQLRSPPAAVCCQGGGRGGVQQAHRGTQLRTLRLRRPFLPRHQQRRGCTRQADFRKIIIMLLKFGYESIIFFISFAPLLYI